MAGDIRYGNPRYLLYCSIQFHWFSSNECLFLNSAGALLRLGLQFSGGQETDPA